MKNNVFFNLTIVFLVIFFTTKLFGGSFIGVSPTKIPSSIEVSTITATPTTPYGGVNVTTNTFIQGNVGIGTTIPRAKLHLIGGLSSLTTTYAFRVFTNDGYERFSIRDDGIFTFKSGIYTGFILQTGNNNATWSGRHVFQEGIYVPSLNRYGSSVDLLIGNSGWPGNPYTIKIGGDTNAQAIIFKNSTSELHKFDLINGNIGIGTITPNYRLVVSSGAGASGTLVAISTGTSEVIRMTGAGEIYANKFYGDGSGLTGISGGDNLGNHIAEQNLNMNWNNIEKVTTITNTRIWEDIIDTPTMPPFFEHFAYNYSSWASGIRTKYWHVVTISPYSGTYCFKAGNISNSEYTDMILYVTAKSSTTFSFAYRVSSETNFDKFILIINDVQKFTASGEIGWTVYSLTLTSGTYRIKFRYYKDIGGHSGLDTAFVDDICFTNQEDIEVCMGNLANSTKIGGLSLRTSVTPATLNICNNAVIGTSILNTFATQPVPENTLIVEGKIGIGAIPGSALDVRSNRIDIGPLNASTTTVRFNTRRVAFDFHWRDGGIDIETDRKLRIARGSLIGYDSEAIYFPTATVICQNLYLSTATQYNYQFVVDRPNKVIINFDDGQLPDFFTFIPTTPKWLVETEYLSDILTLNKRLYGYGYLSAPVYSVSNSTAQFTAEIGPGGGKIYFVARYCRVKFYFYIDSILKYGYSPSYDTVTEHSFDISEGEHTFSFQAIRDGDPAYLYVDNIVVTNCVKLNGQDLKTALFANGAVELKNSPLLSDTTIQAHIVNYEYKTLFTKDGNKELVKEFFGTEDIAGESTIAVELPADTEIISIPILQPLGNYNVNVYISDVYISSFTITNNSVNNIRTGWRALGK